MRKPVETFELKEAHLKLLMAASWDWNGAEFGAPTIDPKKPFGSSFPIRSICEILDVEYPDEDELLDQPEEYDRQCDELHKRFMPLHYSLLKALQVIFSTAKMKPGLYRKKDEYSSEWELVETADDKLKRLALEAANALWAIAEGKEPDRPPKDINQDIYRMFGSGGLEYPEGMRVKVIKENDYNLSIGTVLKARWKDGDGSPFPIDAGRYQFKEDEVEVL
jgi:hypothetical protein